MILLDSIINFSDSLIKIAKQNNDTIINDSSVILPVKKAIQLSLDPINSVNSDWVIYWISLVGILVLISKMLFPRHFNNTIQALLNTRAYNNLINEGINWKHTINLILLSAYTLSIGLILYIVTSHVLHNSYLLIKWDFSLALNIILSILLLIISKLLIVLFTNITFQIRELIRNYLNYLFLSYSFLGISLFFMLWIIIYVNYQFGIYLSIIIIAMVYLFRIYKLLSLCNSKNNFNLFHFIIYLCTVEILPIIIFKKLYFIWFLGS